MLDERKLQVLYAIINSYIFSGEPIGSRTISKNFSLGVSSATIRNEMSDLEELGYLSKPHTSSGRIPSDKAYRHYVNHFLEKKVQQMHMQNQKMLEMFKSEIRDTDRWISQATKILSALTKYTSIGIVPQSQDKKIARIQFVPMEGNYLLCLLIFDHHEVDQFMIRLSENLSEEALYSFSVKLNHLLYQVPLDKVVSVFNEEVLREMREYHELLQDLLPMLEKQAKDSEHIEVSLQGVSNIFYYPEYSDLEKAKEFVTFLEDKENLMRILNDKDDELIIRIGKENTFQALSDSSVILTALHDGGNIIGHVGIIGPMRMDYKKVLEALWSLNLEVEKGLED